MFQSAAAMSFKRYIGCMREDKTWIPGVYDQIIDQDLSASVALIHGARIDELNKDDRQAAADLIADHVRQVVAFHLQSGTFEQGLADLNEMLRKLGPGYPMDGQDYVRALRSIPTDLGSHRNPPRSGLRHSLLLTNDSGEANIWNELTSELESADSVDIVMAFVKWTGIRTIKDLLGILAQRGVPVRLVTSTYLGVTERQALDRLVKDYGVKVKVNYDPTKTRLHAKAWLIRRNTGFDTAFIGSSNMSRSAMVDGVEWNVRLARHSSPAVFDKFAATFDSYWESADYHTYDPETDAGLLDEALHKAGHRPGKVELAHGLDARPYAYQQRMLDELEAARQHGHHKNLIVAATGTGKTVMAAFDYARMVGPSDRALFVVHRKEILHQAQRTFAQVMKRTILGYVSDEPITRQLLDSLDRYHGTLFATVQSLHETALHQIPRDFFDYVIIDEFHHAEAKTYRAVLDRLQPRELLGLTATPERGDGINVADEFFDGRIASELRLWEALDDELLAPFHYYLISDDTDLSTVPLRGGEYETSALSKIYTGNDARVRAIVNAINDAITDLSAINGICFCVDIAHADYMAERLSAHGIASIAVTSKTHKEDRKAALESLRAGEISFICAVDIFNEGVDIPAVNTLLFLRPTASATIFLQQLGRGLRRHSGKTVATVLDFVGNQKKGFRFDNKLTALTGLRGKKLVQAVNDNALPLPSGSQIVLDKIAQDVVLDSMREVVHPQTPALIKLVRQAVRDLGVSASELQLEQFLTDHGIGLESIYRPGKYQNEFMSWQRMTRLADGQDPGQVETHLWGRVRSLARVNDEPRRDAYLRILSSCSSFEELGADQLWAMMLFYSFFPQGIYKGKRLGIDEGLDLIRNEPGLVSELEALWEVSVDDHLLLTAPDWNVSSPLLVGAHYSREELLAGLGLGFAGNGLAPGNVREGVKFIEHTGVDALLVTLQKSEKDLAAHLRYKDYALSDRRFHWQSQATTSATSLTAQRYQDPEAKIGLFVREAKRDAFGEGAPFMFAGPVTHVSSRGSNPVSIEWDLAHRLRPEMYVAARAVAS